VADYRVAFLQLRQFAFQPLALGGDFVGNLVDKVAAQGEWLKGKLAELQKRYPVIGHVRGLGLMIGIPRTWPITG
jgi:hypothetical protein